MIVCFFHNNLNKKGCFKNQQPKIEQNAQQKKKKKKKNKSNQIKCCYVEARESTVLRIVGECAIFGEDIGVVFDGGGNSDRSNGFAAIPAIETFS